MQATSDIFLGWQRVEGFDGQDRDFYLRQLRDGKGSVVVETMVADGMAFYGRLCGQTLARAHARSGDRVAIANYLGSSDHSTRRSPTSPRPTPTRTPTTTGSSRPPSAREPSPRSAGSSCDGGGVA